MHSRNLLALGATAAAALTLAACGSSNSTTTTSSSTPSAAATGTISGAGSTFAQPVYGQWGSELHGITLNYQSVGSGAGITALENKTVDFGASDPPLKPADIATLAKNGSPVQQLPMTKWNSPEIATLNPGLSLPSTTITVIHRSDSSGTTAGFTGFLAAYSPAWKAQVGSGKDVQWPTGTGAKGNAGVAGAVQETPGSIGYVEQAYALQHNFTYASVQNEAGQFAAEPVVRNRSQDSGCHGLPDRLADLPHRVQGHVQGRDLRGHR